MNRRQSARIPATRKHATESEEPYEPSVRLRFVPRFPGRDIIGRCDGSAVMFENSCFPARPYKS